MNLKAPWAGCAVAVITLATIAPLHAGPSDPQTPTPTSSVQASPTPKLIERHEAPAGVYYLLEDTAVPLKNGIRGISAGTEVKVIKDEGNMLQVIEGDFEFTIKKTQVTNNLDIAATIQRRAAAINSANERGLQQQQAILIKQQQDEIEFLRTHPLATPTPTPSPRGRN